MERIPTETFDTSKHRISCREAETGRQVWVTLESLAAAERVIERVFEPAPAVTGDFATKSDLLVLRDAMSRAVSETMQPPEVSQEILSVMSEAAAGMAVLMERLQKLEAAVRVHEENFSYIRSKGAA